LNAHSIYGLQQGVKYLNEIGLDKIIAHKKELVKYFYQELLKIDGLKIYGNFTVNDRAAVIAINYRDVYSYEFAEALYDDYRIATRAQSHCAPLIHEHYQTEQQGMVRFSFSYFNTLEEVKVCLEAIKQTIIKFEGD
jgi:selenocysteine lyase/cysteine desulfurase